MKLSSADVFETVALAAVVCMLVSPPLLLTSKAFSMGQIPSTSKPTSTFQPSSRLMDSGVRFVMDSSITPVTMKVAQNIAIKDPPRVHKIVLIAKEENLTLPQGNNITAYTWNGTVPSPTIRVTQGDLLNITIVNPPTNTQPHSLDMHASIISAVPNYGPILPGQERSYAFIATQPGFFKYHCEGNAVLAMDQHVFSGMAGGVIVDPANGYTGYIYPTYDDSGNKINQTVNPNAKEIQFIFSEWYLNNDGTYNQTAMFNHQPTYATVNGIPFGYDPVVTKTKGAMPIHIKQGDHVRFFLLNVGDADVNFHIVGQQLARVTDGQLVAGWGKQTYLLGGSNDAIVDVVFNKPGVYAPVNHDYAYLFKGQAVIVVVDGPDGQPGKTLGLKDYKNPSNAVPPTGKNSIPIETTPYQLGTPLKLTSLPKSQPCHEETCPSSSPVKTGGKNVVP
ncbi:MAG TPA: multicopper oxidase domain-containing protein [Nitrososphaeraceae archaeon]|jgi:nitrite reductase (NO-forming)